MNNECDEQLTNDENDNHLNLKLKGGKNENVKNKNRFRDRSLNASISSAASSASKLIVNLKISLENSHFYPFSLKNYINKKVLERQSSE